MTRVVMRQLLNIATAVIQLKMPAIGAPLASR